MGGFKSSAIFVLKSLEQGNRWLLIGGKPINESIVQYCPFVMNSEAKIRQALSAFQQNRLTAFN